MSFLGTIKALIPAPRILLYTVALVFTYSLVFWPGGKQPASETASALIVVVGAGALVLINKKITVQSGPVPYLWVLLLLYNTLLIPFSDDMGYSVSSVIRLFIACGTYYIFYNLALRRGPRAVARATCVLFVFAIAAVVAEAFFNVSLPDALSSSIVGSRGGHRNLSAVLLLGFPLVLYQTRNNKKFSVLLVFLFGVASALTLSRGFLAILTVFVLLRLITAKKKAQETGLITMLLLIIGTTALFLRSSQAPWAQRGAFSSKTPVLHDARLDYWTQALRAVRERPLFGSGPGTFFLQSLRFRTTEGKYSTYAHGFALQTLTETGALGLFLLGLVLLFTARGARVSAKHSRDGQIKSALLMGLLLSFAYSFIEINFDFMAFWVIFWAILGDVSRSDYEKIHTVPSKGIIAFLTPLALFVAVSFLSYLPTNSPARTWFLLPPGAINTDHAMALMKQHTSLNNNDKLVRALVPFHKNNPIFLSGAARLLTIREPEEAEKIFKKILVLSPLDTDARQEYLKFLLKHGKLEKVTETIASLHTSCAEGITTNAPSPFVLKDKSLHAVNIIQIGFQPGFSLSCSELLAKLYYFIGLSVYISDPLYTKELWLTTTQLLPDWSYFYLELAGLGRYVLKDESLLRTALRLCAQNVKAKEHCMQIARSEEQVYEPGRYTKHIQSIPYPYFQ